MFYKFECKECKHKQEEDIPMSEYDSKKDSIKCEKCGGDCKRVLEPFAVEMNVGYNAENHIRSKWQG